MTSAPIIPAAHCAVVHAANAAGISTAHTHDLSRIIQVASGMPDKLARLAESLADLTEPWGRYCSGAVKASDHQVP